MRKEMVVASVWVKLHNFPEPNEENHERSY
jgi:hypothetical protein